ncbi:hypothetical protein VHA01S_031_00480 [Vibrio halioticoli NBRC 102217]|uniref:PRD domain-containing protein n=2 Tax=Vibrio halioticoli TaxID=71388 RepID=V5FJW5_9VIBR|nr:hypothetical protein VHA01S_031_00480 [Vibrio halioticoli NBRC 102217]
MHERMTLLLNSGVISSNAHLGAMAAIKTLNDEWALCTDNEQFQMAMTHLARAIDRISDNEAIKDGLDPTVMDEIISDAAFPEIIEMNEKICRGAGLVEVPVTEDSFFICNLFSLYLASH